MTSTKHLEPITITGSRVRLEPLSESHLDELYALGQEPAIWAYLSNDPFRERSDATNWFEKARSAMLQGKELPFAVVDLQSGRVAGTSRYLDLRLAHRGLEIGSTWYGAPFRRTHVNTETKYLLLEHAFEQLELLRVQFLTDARNATSQKALERIGALREGTLRQHKVYSSGYVRDSAVYSITASEWPSVRSLLQEKLQHEH